VQIITYANLITSFTFTYIHSVTINANFCNLKGLYHEISRAYIWYKSKGIENLEHRQYLGRLSDPSCADKSTKRRLSILPLQNTEYLPIASVIFQWSLAGALLICSDVWQTVRNILSHFLTTYVLLY